MPAFPAHLAKYLSWDLKPLRPWEWEAMVACEWRAAQLVHEAWHDGERDAENFVVQR